ncbi:winged helix-turn-helix domain-containing protein [Photobacterium sp. DNB23_23_1]|uniref:Winged helix DNA-binding domain-containing protein n=1 Tax=Photobacterium pectinilyticum TaxID=2906793 RepID=A0ABT1N039_9GAMM|nr:crosslink repair DNA glycosylase YcaQ family protein [Photobacterium sp. ZSDE20]MCQ1058103.1 winged helix DNA-binding domain-containing protein [Photobacterium sp. ZSDE20]MDD1822636.1 winged helix DNA-binding domain-containing protein [Photobacterium sp. ZSDE20]
MKSLSISEARKLVLLSQGLSPKQLKGHALSKTLSVFCRLGYVQIDTISVVQRAHHHTLWSRNQDYRLGHLDQLVADRKVFEYWSHAASYLLMDDYRFTLPRKLAIKSGVENHWYRKDPKLMANVLSRIEIDGPLMAKDFESQRTNKNGWASKPTKQALEMLYMQGDLMISERRNFHKVYDLTERVLPKGIDASVPTQQEHGRFLVFRYLKANGFGTLAEMTYLLKGVKAQVKCVLEQLLESGEIEKIIISDDEYFTCSESLFLLNTRLTRKHARILSPFDNMLIQRNRTSTIFNFDYQLECYVPAPKRKFGYFCLPILWDGKLVARADCKVNKPASKLELMHLYVEPSLKERDAFLAALAQELQAFTKFNQCGEYSIQKVSYDFY